MKVFQKIAKKISIMLLIASVLLTNFSKLSYAATTHTGANGVVISYITQTTDVIPSKSGDKVIVTVKIKNTDHNMENFMVTPSSSGSSFFVTAGYSSALVNKDDEVEVSLAGTYKGEGDRISCKIEYNYNGDKYVYDDAGVSVVTNAAAPSGVPSLIVPNVIDTLKVNSTGTYSVKFSLKNNGSGLAKNIVITPNFANTPFKSTSDIYRIEKIGSNGIADTTIEFSAKLAATKGTYGIPFSYTYTDDAGNSYSGSYTVYAESGQGKTSPNLMVTNLKVSDSSIMAGDKFDITYDLKNTGELPAYDVKVKVVGFGKETFIPSGVTTTNVFTQIAGAEIKPIKYSLTTSPTIIGDIYEVEIQISYKDSDGKEITDTNTAYITAGAASSSIVPKLVIQSALQDKTMIDPGSDFNIIVKLGNKGAQTAKNIKATLTGFSTATFIPTDKTDFKFVNDIAGSATTEIVFPLTAVESIAKGMHELTLTVAYTDASGKEYTELSKVYITDVQGAAEGSTKGTPKIIINSFSVDTGVAKAGQQINFTFSFKNTSAVKKLTNMKITLNSPPNKDGVIVFSVAEGSNTYYIKNVGTEEVIEKTMAFDVKTDAVSGSYPLEIVFEYEDEEGNPFPAASETIYIPVDELAKPVINRIDVPPYAETFSQQMISFEFFNMGKSKLNNVQATIEGGVRPIKALTYIGNIEPGKGDTYDVEIMCETAGEITGTLVVSYENSRGELVETRQDFTMFVQEPYIPEFPTEPGMPIDPIEEVKAPILPVPAIIGIEIGLFLIALLVTKGVIISKKKKKLRSEEEI
jgi:hypothetical protein